VQVQHCPSPPAGIRRTATEHSTVGNLGNRCSGTQIQKAKKFML